jgi:hypothetical protein
MMKKRGEDCEWNRSNKLFLHKCRFLVQKKKKKKTETAKGSEALSVVGPASDVTSGISY